MKNGLKEFKDFNDKDWDVWIDSMKQLAKIISKPKQNKHIDPDSIGIEQKCKCINAKCAVHGYEDCEHRCTHPKAQE
jgi:hypothetical protein